MTSLTQRTLAFTVATALAIPAGLLAAHGAAARDTASRPGGSVVTAPERPAPPPCLLTPKQDRPAAHTERVPIAVPEEAKAEWKAAHDAFKASVRQATETFVEDCRQMRAIVQEAIADEAEALTMSLAALRAAVESGEGIEEAKAAVKSAAAAFKAAMREARDQVAPLMKEARTAFVRAVKQAADTLQAERKRIRDAYGF